MNRVIVAVAASVWSFVVLATACASPPPPGETVASILWIREHSAVLVRHAKATLGDQQKSDAEQRYGTLQASGNAYIALVELGLVAENQNEQLLEKAAKEVAGNYSAFRAAAQPGVDDRLAAADIVAGIIKGLVDGGVIVWKAVREDNKATIESLKKQYEGYRFPNWSDIKP